MSYDAIISGAVIAYPYLWRREAERGETEGRKTRPAVVAVRVARTGNPDLVILFPITTKAPEPGRFAAEIPETEKRRAGLGLEHRQWVILDECNEETIPGTHYLEPGPPMGSFSKRFFLPLVMEFIRRRGEVRVVGRGGLTHPMRSCLALGAA